MTVSRELTRQECRAKAEGIQETFERYGLPISPSSDIAVFIKEMAWLAEHIEGDHSSLTKKERNRFTRALLLVEQAQHVAAVFSWLRQTKIPDASLRSLKNRLNRLSRDGNPKGRDILFELEVAGRLSRHPPMAIRFAEPDIIIDWPDGQVGLACKRPRSLKNVARLISKAANQGLRADVPFFVIVGVEDLVNGKFILAETQERFEQICDDVMEELRSKCSEPGRRAVAKGAGAVILASRFIGAITVPEGGVGFVRWLVRHRIAAAREDELTRIASHALVELME